MANIYDLRRELKSVTTCLEVLNETQRSIKDGALELMHAFNWLVDVKSNLEQRIKDIEEATTRPPQPPAPPQEERPMCILPVSESKWEEVQMGSLVPKPRRRKASKS
jgi:hypothetical protein